MDDFESELRRFRPVGPPPELRDRIVAARRVGEPSRIRRVREWMPAAAALVLTTIFYWLAANERRITAAMFTPVPPIDQAAADPVDRMEPPL